MSNTPTFAKDGEERPGQHMPESSTNEINIPLSVPTDDHNPISSDSGNPLRPDVNNNQLPSSSTSSHAIGCLSKSDIEPTLDVKSKAEANEVPDTKTETKSIVSTESTTANVEAEHLFPTYEARIEPALTANLKDEPPSQASETVTKTRSQATKMETEPSSHAPASFTKPMPQEPKLEKESPSQVSETQTELASPAMKSQTGSSSQEPKTKIDPANPKAEPLFCKSEPETEPANNKSKPPSQVPETELSYQPITMEPGRPPSLAPETRSTSGKSDPPCLVGEAESETKLANPISEPQITIEPSTPKAGATSSDAKPENADGRELHGEAKKTELPLPTVNGNSDLQNSFLLDENHEGSESGTEEEQSAFMKELENFFRDRGMEFKPPKFYGEGLNCLKLWRAVMRLGGYDKVTSCKLWRQVGESFKPPKTCTTVSWTFRGFYEKALLDYERHKTSGGELSVIVANPAETMNIDSQASGSGRARRDAAARAMQGWHSQRVLGNGEVSDPIIKDKNSTSLQKREKQLKSLGLLKRKKPSELENAVKAARTRPSKPQLDVAVVDIGQPAEWVKVNVQKTKDCFEVYALVPGLLREEVRVQSDPAGRLVISGEPEHPDNPWGVTPFKKVISLPARIDPHQTSAVVTLHGQLFVRVPFEQSDL